jgi:hypothetical protein
MTLTKLAYLNEIFADKLGRIPTGFPYAGQSSYQFKRLKELTFPFRDGFEQINHPSGLAEIVPSYSEQQQMPGEEDRWCIARWMKPGWSAPGMDGAFGEPGEPVTLSLDEWQEKYGESLGYPSGGWWLLIQPLNIGYVPDEKWTRWAADHLDWQGSLSLRETFRLLTERRNRVEEKHRQDVVACLRECWTGHVPGVRGGNYLAFSSTRKGLETK